MAGFDKAMDVLMRDCLDELASDGGFLHESRAGSRRVEAIFDSDYELVTLDDGAQASSCHPVISVHARDFPDGISRADKFVRLLTNERFAVRDVQRDSGFGILVILHKEDSNA